MTAVRRLLRQPAFWGILLRLLVMPIACHYDLLSYYWAAHEVVFHHHKPFEGQLLSDLYFFSPTSYLNIAWLWFIQPLMGSRDPWAHDWFPGGDVYQINETAWRAFVSVPNIGLILFLFKLPYLVGEWVMIRWLLAMKPNPVERRRLSTFLWLNPISLFVLYVYGSMEIFVMVLLVASLLCAFHNRLVRSAVVLGCSALFRLFPALLFPWFALGCGRRPAERWRLGMLVCLPLFAWLGVMILRHPDSLAFMANYPSMNFLLSLKFPLQVHGSPAYALYPFVIGYIVVMGVWATRRGRPLARVIDGMLVTLLVFYATCYVHPQYFVWFIPFLAFRVASHPGLVRLFAIQVLCYVVLTFQWGRPLAGYLFAPLNAAFFMNLRSPMECLAPLGPPEKIVGLAHSVLAAVSLWMVYRILTPVKEKA